MLTSNIRDKKKKTKEKKQMNSWSASKRSLLRLVYFTTAPLFSLDFSFLNGLLVS